MPFHQAHSVVGSLVPYSLERHVSSSELVEAHPALETDAMALLEPGAAVTRRTTPGGAGPLPVAVEMDRFVLRLQADQNRSALVD